MGELAIRPFPFGLPSVGIWSCVQSIPSTNSCQVPGIVWGSAADNLEKSWRAFGFQEAAACMHQRSFIWLMLPRIFYSRKALMSWGVQQFLLGDWLYFRVAGTERVGSWFSASSQLAAATPPVSRGGTVGLQNEDRATLAQESQRNILKVHADSGCSDSS